MVLEWLVLSRYLLLAAVCFHKVAAVKLHGCIFCLFCFASTVEATACNLSHNTGAAGFNSNPAYNSSCGKSDWDDCQSLRTPSVDFVRRSFTFQFWARKAGSAADGAEQYQPRVPVGDDTINNNYIFATVQNDDYDWRTTCNRIAIRQRLAGEYEFSACGTALTRRAYLDDAGEWHHLSFTFDVDTFAARIFRDGGDVTR